MDRFQYRLGLLRRLACLDSSGNHKAPKPHERANGRIHRQEITQHHSALFAPDTDFSTTAVVARHDPAD